jgi:hypothetical protein
MVNPRSWNIIPGQFEVRTTIWNVAVSDVVFVGASLDMLLVSKKEWWAQQRPSGGGKVCGQHLSELHLLVGLGL